MKYQYRYPEQYNHFNNQDGTQSALSADKMQLINEYDNAVRYNDHVVYELIHRLQGSTQKQQSLLVYFSDHGEDVYDTKPFTFQGRNEGKPTYPMYAIPFIVWHSPNWQLADKLADPEIRNRQYDNADFIYTWSDLLGLSYDRFKDDESLLSKRFSRDSILVGNPYQRSHLKALAGTTTNSADYKASVVTPILN